MSKPLFYRPQKLQLAHHIVSKIYNPILLWIPIDFIGRLAMLISDIKGEKMNSALKWFYTIWFGLFVGLNLLGIIVDYLSTRSLYETWLYVTELYSPFNIWNLIFSLISLSPAIVAYMWREKRLKKSPNKSGDTI